MEEVKQMHELSIPRVKVIASTKSELYKLLKNQGNYYLPPLSQTDGGYIHDVMTGIKKVQRLSHQMYRFISRIRSTTYQFPKLKTWESEIF